MPGQLWQIYLIQYFQQLFVAQVRHRTRINQLAA